MSILKSKGFTLIELLIVVAIIAILAAIAIPNFLQAQIRAKVSRVRSEQRTTTTALESYMVDNNTYPWYNNPHDNLSMDEFYTPLSLTTPVAFITSLYNDVFPNLHAGLDTSEAHPFHYYHAGQSSDDILEKYTNYNMLPTGSGVNAQWAIISHGPDTDDDECLFAYDPTNGTVSNGDIARFGP